MIVYLAAPIAIGATVIPIAIGTVVSLTASSGNAIQHCVRSKTILTPVLLPQCAIKIAQWIYSENQMFRNLYIAYNSEIQLLYTITRTSLKHFDYVKDINCITWNFLLHLCSLPNHSKELVDGWKWQL